MATKTIELRDYPGLVIDDVVVSKRNAAATGTATKVSLKETEGTHSLVYYVLVLTGDPLGKWAISTPTYTRAVTFAADEDEEFWLGEESVRSSRLSSRASGGYSADVLKVMIASPGDVAAERQTARDVIYEWNCIHSEDRALVLMPVGWETHSAPSMGDRPQAIINKEVLMNCDLLVAVFWTRIGSPTGVAASGTVEEIEEHLNAGKPAMIYFSSTPVRPDSVDEAQYSALKEFKQECYAKGLVESYESLAEFRDKFSRQLTQTIIRHFLSETTPTTATAPPPPTPGPEMTDEAK
ncbi:hypothetical protein SH528x_006147 [Novipirellula sp. SH528]|uniref:hypothetical protein n=1 Tax=Novipirellula sp. SH528 TaxID=3454466 RepID=UPI003FA18F56